MSSKRVTVCGKTYTWRPVKLSDETVSKTQYNVFWLRDAEPRTEVEIGRIIKAVETHGSGWGVIPRLGGRRRAQSRGCGFARTREMAIRCLVSLAETEPSLTVSDKVKFNIIFDNGNGPVDASASVVPLSATTI